MTDDALPYSNTAPRLITPHCPFAFLNAFHLKSLQEACKGTHEINKLDIGEEHPME
jgi:hypothetical protein